MTPDTPHRRSPWSTPMAPAAPDHHRHSRGRCGRTRRRRTRQGAGATARPTVAGRLPLPRVPRGRRGHQRQEWSGPCPEATGRSPGRRRLELRPAPDAGGMLSYTGSMTSCSPTTRAPWSPRSSAMNTASGEFVLDLRQRHGTRAFPTSPAGSRSRASRRSAASRSPTVHGKLYIHRRRGSVPPTPQGISATPSGFSAWSQVVPVSM